MTRAELDSVWYAVTFALAGQYRERGWLPPGRDSGRDTVTGEDCAHRIAVTPRNGAPHGPGFACSLSGGRCLPKDGCGYTAIPPAERETPKPRADMRQGDGRHLPFRGTR